MTSVTQQPSFDDLMAGVDANMIAEMASKVAREFDDRATFERRMRPNNESIQKTLAKSRAKLIQAHITQAMFAANVAPNFVNRSLAADKRYNVYAIEKAADLLATLAGKAQLNNAINRAIVKSMIAFRASGVAFTGNSADAATSDKIKVENGTAKLLTRHTVSASTAPTQSSSTMNALETLGIVRNTGTFRQPVYELTALPQTEKLVEIAMTV